MRYSAMAFAVIPLFSILNSSLLTACNASSGSSTGDPLAQNNTTQTGQFTPGCSVAPACGTCGTCAEKCYCATGNIAQCAADCSSPDAGTWTPSTSPTADPTSTATTSPTSTATSVPTSDPTAMPTTTATSTATATATGTDTSQPIDPPPPANEFTITSASFDIAPGGEVYKCQNFHNPLGMDVAVVETTSFMAAGSHHMFVFNGTSFNQDTNVAADCSGNEFHDYIHVAQVPQETITYPAGVGRSLKGDQGLRILAHYLNTGSTTLTAQIAVTFKYVAPTDVQYLAAQMFLNQGGLFVPPGVSTQSSTFSIPYDIEMLHAVSHMHKHGTRFVATTNAGQNIYDGTDWDEPVENHFLPPMHIAAGSQLTWACTFNNDTGGYLRFGDSAITDEMCILNAVFYPSDMTQHQGAPLDSTF